MATQIEDLVGEMTIQEQALNLKYQMELNKLQEWTGDAPEPKRYNTQHYVQITGEDWSDSYVWALARTIMNCREKVKDVYAGGTENMIKGTILGMMAEIKAAEKFESCWDRNIHFRKGSTDMIIKGYKVDIKANQIHNNYRDDVVVSETKKLGQSDYFFFGRLLSNTTFNFFGWIDEKSIIDDKNKRSCKTGYWIERTKLLKFSPKEY